MNTLDWVILAFILIGFFIGLYRGFFRELVGTVGILLAAIVANWLSPYTVPTFGGWIGNQTAAAIILWVVIFLVAMFAMKGVAYLLKKLLETATLGWMNRLLGGLAAALKYAFIAALVVALIETLGGIAPDMPLHSEVKESHIVPVLHKVIAWVMPWLNEYIIQPAKGLL